MNHPAGNGGDKGGKTGKLGMIHNIILKRRQYYEEVTILYAHCRHDLSDFGHLGVPSP
jgi:hypothetical protein